MRGILIVFEGKDKCGKTTQAKLLVKKLNDMNIKTKYIAFPHRYTEIGKKIDKYLKKEICYTPKEIEKLLAENRKEMQSYIKSNLQNNINIVLDRYYISGIVYSIALGIEPDLYLNNGIIEPDVTILMDYVYGKVNNIEKYETIEFQSKLNFYGYIEENWCVFDYPSSIEKINNDIIDIIKPKLNTNNKIQYIEF